MTEPQIGTRNLDVMFQAKARFTMRPRQFHVLHKVSFDIKMKDTFCLIGESGSGKTTLINTLLGFHPFQQGRILYNGQCITKSNDTAHRKLQTASQLVFQDPAASLSPFLTLRESVEEPLRARGVGQKERTEKVEKLAHWVDLPAPVLDRPPSQASGGQKQRACIARALSVTPQILFLDEPLSALDMLIQKQVAELLRRIKKSHAITFFLVTHNLGLVRQIGTFVAVMYLGKIVEKAPKDLFFAHPRHPYSQALLSSVLEPGLWNGKRIVLEGEIPSSGQATSGCPFYPRCFRKGSVCAKIVPSGKTVAAGHEVFCHRY